MSCVASQRKPGRSVRFQPSHGVLDKNIVDAMVPERACDGGDNRIGHQSANGTGKQEPSQQPDTGVALEARAGG